MSEAGDGTGGSAGGGNAGDGAGAGDNSGGAGDGAGNGNGDGGNDGGQGGDGGKPDDKGGDQGDGKGKLSDEEARLLKEVMKKKESLDKTNQELAKAKEQLKKFDGIDPEAVRQMLRERDDADKKQLEAKGDWERLKQRMAEEHVKEIDALKGNLDQSQNALQKALSTINDLSVGTQFGQSKLISDELTLTPSKARVIYGEYFDVVDGKVIGYDKPKGAENRTAIVDQYGNNVGFDDALRKIIDTDPEKDYLFKSKAKPGAGSDSAKPSGKGNDKPAETDSIGKIALGLKNLGKPSGNVL